MTDRCSAESVDAWQRDAIAQALLDRFIERGMARISGPTFPPGTKVQTLVRSYRDDFYADADAVLTSLNVAQPPQPPSEVYTEICHKDGCPRGGIPVQIVGSATKAMQERNLRVCDAAAQPPQPSAESATGTDADWAAKLGIVCRYPDGADRCSGCPHYQDPKRYPVCDYTPDPSQPPQPSADAAEGGRYAVDDPWCRPRGAAATPLGPCTQAELDAFEGLDSKSKQLFLMWVERARKAEAIREMMSPAERGTL